MSSVSLLVALAVSWSCATAIKDEGKASATGGGFNSSQRWSDCPGECSQCCPMHAMDQAFAPIAFFAQLWDSRDRYKCVLKEGSILPDPDDCTVAEGRTHSGGQSKTKCKFSPQQIENEAWVELAKTPCAKETKCCCDKTDGWTEFKCMALNQTSKRVEATSTHGDVESMQTYEKQDQDYSSTKTTCMRSDSDRLEFSQPPSRPYDANWKQTLSHNDRCCVKSRQKKSSEKVNFRMETSMCYIGEPEYPGWGDETNPPMWCEKQVHDWAHFAWTECAKYEQLFHCSENGGATQNGQKYARISTKKGTCVEQNTCPEGSSNIITGHSCQCNVDCGR